MENSISKKITKTLKFKGNYTNCSFGGFIANVHTLKSVELNVNFWVGGDEANRQYLKGLYRKTKKIIAEEIQPAFYDRFISIQDTPFQLLESRNIYNEFVFNIYPKSKMNYKEVQQLLQPICDKINEEVFNTGQTRKRRNG
jgi:hypothetical protein